VGGRAGFTTKERQVLEPEPDVELIPPAAQAEPVVDGLEDEVVHKITKQVGVLFSRLLCSDQTQILLGDVSSI